jgi:hypothetical protein
MEYNKKGDWVIHVIGQMPSLLINEKMEDPE